MVISLLASRNLVNSFHGSYSTYSAPADVLHLSMAFEKVGGATSLMHVHVHVCFVEYTYIDVSLILLYPRQCCNDELELVRDSEKHIKYVIRCTCIYLVLGTCIQMHTQCNVRFSVLHVRQPLDLARLYM